MCSFSHPQIWLWFQRTRVLSIARACTSKEKVNVCKRNWTPDGGGGGLGRTPEEKSLKNAEGARESHVTVPHGRAMSPHISLTFPEVKGQACFFISFLTASLHQGLRCSGEHSVWCTWEIQGGRVLTEKARKLGTRTVAKIRCLRNLVKKKIKVTEWELFKKYTHTHINSLSKTQIYDYRDAQT